MICQVGTFDVENYGDLLYPLVFRHLLDQRNPGLRLRLYSPLSGPAPYEAAFETHSIRSLFQETTPCTIVVGGGDILRTDWNVVAQHYGRESRLSYKQLRHAIGTSGSAGYLLRKSVPRLEARRFYAEHFEKRWLSYPAAGPFIIDPESLPAGSTVSYVSCGVPHELTASVRETFERARYVYLRDEKSVEK